MTELDPYLWPLVGTLLFFVLLFLLKKGFSSRSFPYEKRHALLTPAEQKFHRTLKAVLPPDLSIYVKVRLGDIIWCSDADWRRGWGPRISAKHIDFVLVDEKSWQVRLCIELDDRSHNRPDRRARDAFVNKALQVAGVPLLRVPASRGYDMGNLRAQIEHTLQ